MSVNFSWTLCSNEITFFTTYQILFHFVCCNRKRIFRIFFVHYLCEHVIGKSIGVIYSLGASTICQLSSKGVKRYWADKILSQVQQFDLNLWLYDLKNNGVIYFLGASTTPSLTTFKHWDQKLLSRLHLVDRSTNRCKTIYTRFSKGGGHKYESSCTHCSKVISKVKVFKK